MSTIAIGRRTVDQNLFEQAITNSKNWREVCRKLDFNETVRTTIEKIQEQAEALGLNISHFSSNRNFNTNVKPKEYNIIPENYKYFEAFEPYVKENFKKDSHNTYFSGVRRFLEALGEKELASIEGHEIDEHCGKKKTATIAVKSFLRYLVKADVYNFGDECNRKLMKWLVVNG